MVNILMSTYNGARYITEQLDSILAQTYSDYHVYIRDDGSQDETVSVVETYIQRKGAEDRMTLAAENHIGFSASFFRLLHQAEKGDYWAFCDQDDVWYPDKLYKAVTWMDRQDGTRPLLYHSAFDLGNEDMTVITPYRPAAFPYRFYNSITSNVFFGFAITVNRALYEMLIQANPEQIKYHDWFAAMITAAFGKYHLSETVEAVHRQHAGNASPLFFLKKIPHGIKMVRGDRFYRRNAQEFERLFGERLSPEDANILRWFSSDRYSFRTACKKAFYRRRWNPQLPVELVLRCGMLLGWI